jgi:arylsulfatase B
VIRAGMLLLLAACGGDSDPADTDRPPTVLPPDTGTTDTVPPGPPGGNVLVVVLDDVGLDKVGVYGEHPDPAPTPVLDGLAAEGVLFEQAYAYSTCSPTRAALLTGRYGRRTGMGEVSDFYAETFNLADDEVTIPEVLTASPLGYTSVASGKWHLVTHTHPDPQHNALAQGFSRYAGTIENLAMRLDRSLPEGTYYAWDRNEEGVVAESTEYATTRQVDDLLERIDGLPEPWFGYLALSAAHGPMQAPPEALYTGPLAADATQPEYVSAMLEAADREIGRMLASIPAEVLARTTVVILGDNGTADQAITPPWDPEKSKNTLYEAGVRVPLIVTGPHVAVPGSRVDAMVHVVDLLPTIAEIAGVDLAGVTRPDGSPLRLDGTSFLPYLADPATPWLRDRIFVEKFAPNGPPPYGASDVRMLRDRDWKVIVDANTGGSELYALVPGQFDEGPDLLAAGPLSAEAEAAWLRLLDEVRVLGDELEYAK